MDRQLNNLFPASLKIGIMEIFGQQSIEAVLLELLSPPADDLQLQTDKGIHRLLHPNEIAILSSYSFPKRRSEYFTGRICAKMATLNFLNRDKPFSPNLKIEEIEITTKNDGRPTLCIHATKAKPPEMDISISHSGDYVVALATETKCGIDLQTPQASLLRVQDRYCNRLEFYLLETTLTTTDTLPRLALLWTAKEAAKKALSHCWMPGFLDLELRKIDKAYNNCLSFSFRTDHKRSQGLPKEVAAAVGMFGEYALAICLINQV